MAISLFQRLFGGSGKTDRPEVRLFVEAMLIMISADGVVEESELDQFVRLVRTRPELQGIEQKVIDGYVHEAFASIRREGIEARLDEIAHGLPERDQRVAALAMAMAIAWGDGGIAPAESEVLERMRQSLAVSKDEFEAAREAIERGLSIEEMIDRSQETGGSLPTAQYYLETLLLMTAADGRLEPRELDRFGQQLAEREEFASLTPDHAAHYLDRALRQLETDGVEARVAAIAEALKEPAQRLAAFRLALEMCIADGDADPHERTLLKLFQARFGISDAQVRAQLDSILATANE